MDHGPAFVGRLKAAIHWVCTAFVRHVHQQKLSEILHARVICVIQSLQQASPEQQSRDQSHLDLDLNSDGGPFECSSKRERSFESSPSPDAACEIQLQKSSFRSAEHAKGSSQPKDTLTNGEEINGNSCQLQQQPIQDWQAFHEKWPSVRSLGGESEPEVSH